MAIKGYLDRMRVVKEISDEALDALIDWSIYAVMEGWKQKGYSERQQSCLIDKIIEIETAKIKNS